MNEYSVGNRLTFRPRTSDNMSLSVKVVKIISSNRSQTLLVTVLPAESSQRTFNGLDASADIVAKIYDPTRYNVRGDEWTGSSATYMRHLHKNEMTAYQRLGSLQGKSVPRFLGEFTYHPAGGDAIHLILLEYIHAPPLPPIESLGSEERSILKDASNNLLNKLRFFGVSHNDLRADNLLWDRQSGLWVVDFEDATCDDEHGFVRDKTYLGLLVTPAEELRSAAERAFSTAMVSVAN